MNLKKGPLSSLNMYSQAGSPLTLCLVTDQNACLGRSLEWVVQEAIQGGVNMVQLREKNADTRAFIEQAQRLQAILIPYQIPLIINDRVDVALAVDADGVHVGQSDMPISYLRRLLPEGKIIGLSAETQEDVLEAENFDLSYLAVSPLFATPSKTDTKKAWGMEGLSWIRRNSRHRLLVIGGVNAENAPEAIRRGAAGIAVISAICSAPMPAREAESLSQAISTNDSL
ncbi:thiamine phosphate synthase [Dyadobacter tibetensis]|uniref:thiamine phosphate synthase n=1 Tax=Dyadobacter tibetensis TaxID=1211851 RepID=UPI0009FE3BBF|nr:thiamine phosphate synthase [Dyadobacter tibetensis]